MPKIHSATPGGFDATGRAAALQRRGVELVTAGRPPAAGTPGAPLVLHG